MGLFMTMMHAIIDTLGYVAKLVSMAVLVRYSGDFCSGLAFDRRQYLIDAGR